MTKSLLLLAIMLTAFTACSKRATNTVEVATPPQEVSRASDTTANTAAPSVTTAKSDQPKSAQEYISAIQKQLASSDPSSTAGNQAIEMAEEGYARFPDDENIIRSLANTLYTSLQTESDGAILTKRRLKLGQLGDTLVKRNRDNLQDLLGLHVTLLLEGAKGHAALGDFDKAVLALEAAREHGFEQVELIYFLPEFEELVTNPAAADMLATWMTQSVQQEMEQHSSFSFEFDLPSFAGENVSLTDYQGKPVVVDLWGTWNGESRAGVADLVQLQESYPQVGFVGINFEQQGGADSLEAAKQKYDEFQETQTITYPCLYGEETIVKQVTGFEDFPTKLIIDGNGQVRLLLQGYHPAAKLKAAIDILLAE